MPLGIERLNVKKTQPNGHINFIKPLPGPDEAIAKDYLERIAAQCRRFFPTIITMDSQRKTAAWVGGPLTRLVLSSQCR